MPEPVSEPPASSGAQKVIGAALGRPRPRGVAAVVMAVVVVVAIVVVPLVINRTGSGARPAASAASGASSQPAVAADAPLAEVLEVAGRVGALPVITWKARPAPPSTVLSDLVVEGEGRTVAMGDAVVLSVATFSASDGTNTTGTDSGTSLFHGLMDPSSLGEALSAAIDGTREGSRIVLRGTVIAEDGTPVTEVTVVDVLHTIAVGQGTTTTEDSPGVTLAEDGSMTVSLNGLPAPTRSTATILVQGDGPQVSASDVVVARHQIVSWADEQVRSTSYGWTTTPGTIDMTDTLAGISHHLVDVNVGSRVLLALPADQARGDEPVVVVIDILATGGGDRLDAMNPDPEATPSPDVVKVPAAGQ